MAEGNALPKEARLRGKKRIDEIFALGKSGFCHPFRYVYVERREDEKPEVAVLISVSKRYHKRAVKRNLLKRRMREAFRLNRDALKDHAALQGIGIDIALIYSTKIIHDYKDIENAVAKILGEIKSHI